jgi:hypothetical protein
MGCCQADAARQAAQLRELEAELEAAHAGRDEAAGQARRGVRAD